MANPMINPLQRVVSKATPNRQPIAPQPEAYVGHNNPYRGTEDHGVPDPGSNVQAYADGNPSSNEGSQSYAANVDAGDGDSAISAITAIERTYRNPRRFVTAQVLASSAVTRPAVSYNPDRNMVRIINLGTLATDVVWVGNSDSVRQYTGYPILPLALGGFSEYVQYSEDEIWCVADSGATGEIALAIVEEFTIYTQQPA